MGTDSILGSGRSAHATSSAATWIALTLALATSICVLATGLSPEPVGAQGLPACIDLEDLALGPLAGSTTSGAATITVDEAFVEAIGSNNAGSGIGLNFNGSPFGIGPAAQATFALPAWPHGWSFEYDWSGAGTTLGVEGDVLVNARHLHDFDGQSSGGALITAPDTGVQGTVEIRGVTITTLTIGANDPINEIDNICPLAKLTPVLAPSVQTTIPSPSGAFACGDAQITGPSSVPLLAWSNVGGPVADYWVYIGSALGEKDYFDSGNVGGANATFVSGLPTDGSTVYVRIYYRRAIQGVAWEWIDTTRSACTQ